MPLPPVPQTWTGVVTGDTLTLNTGSAAGTFATRNVGTGIGITVAGLTISGGPAANYTLTQPTTSANITVRGRCRPSYALR